MPVPDFDALRKWAHGYVSLWNDGDQEGWIANWRAVAPGDFRMFDPVGTPMKEGFDECAVSSWELFQPRVRFRIHPGTLFINGSEVAWLLENHITADGEETVGLSIETYAFGDDGSVLIRTWYKVPGRGEGELAGMFDTYLPDR